MALTFEQIIDDYAKKGLLDGNAADRLLQAHRRDMDVVACAKDKILPILEDAWNNRDDAPAVAELADRIDDALTD